jgi:23S rRNA pseudouridine955/2504/2580 synthase
MKEIVVTSNENGQKAEKFVRKFLSEAPLGFIYKSFRKKDIKVNGHWIHKDFVLHTGDVLRVYVTDQQLADFSKPREAEKKPLDYPIVYEDANVLIVDKPAGLLVYGEDDEHRKTLTRNVIDYLYYKGEYDPEKHAFNPAPAHRLDRNTAGLVIFGKTNEALRDLTALFKDREDISKKYLALVDGDLEGSGTIDKPLKKNLDTGLVSVTPLEKGGKSALTNYKVLHNYKGCTLVECEILTGRTHQIRVHMASIGHPVLGDGKYGNFEDNRKYRSLYGLTYQFLHAHEMSFGKLEGVLAPLSEKTFVSELTKQEQAILAKLPN